MKDFNLAYGNKASYEKEEGDFHLGNRSHINTIKNNNLNKHENSNNKLTDINSKIDTDDEYDNFSQFVCEKLTYKFSDSSNIFNTSSFYADTFDNLNNNKKINIKNEFSKSLSCYNEYSNSNSSYINNNLSYDLFNINNKMSDNAALKTIEKTTNFNNNYNIYNKTVNNNNEGEIFKVVSDKLNNNLNSNNNIDINNHKDDSNNPNINDINIINISNNNTSVNQSLIANSIAMISKDNIIFSILKKESINKKIIRLLKKNISIMLKQDKSLFKELINSNNNFWIAFAMDNKYLPPCKIQLFDNLNETAEFKSFNEPYLKFIFNHQKSDFFYSEMLKMNKNSIIDNFSEIIKKYKNGNQNSKAVIEKELEILNFYVLNLPNIYSKNYNDYNFSMINMNKKNDSKNNKKNIHNNSKNSSNTNSINKNNILLENNTISISNNEQVKNLYYDSIKKDIALTNINIDLNKLESFSSYTSVNNDINTKLEEHKKFTYNFIHSFENRMKNNKSKDFLNKKRFLVTLNPLHILKIQSGFKQEKHSTNNEKDIEMTTINDSSDKIINSKYNFNNLNPIINRKRNNSDNIDNNILDINESCNLSCSEIINTKCYNSCSEMNSKDNNNINIATTKQIQQLSSLNNNLKSKESKLDNSTTSVEFKSDVLSNTNEIYDSMKDILTYKFELFNNNNEIFLDKNGLINKEDKELNLNDLIKNYSNNY